MSRMSLRLGHEPLRIGEPIPAAKHRSAILRHSMLPPEKSRANPKLAFAIALIAPTFLFGAALFFLLITLSSPVISSIRLLTWYTPTGPGHTPGVFSLGVLGACQEGFDLQRPICSAPVVGYEVEDTLGGQVDVKIVAKGLTGPLFLNPFACIFSFATFCALIMYYHTERWKRTTRVLIHFSTGLSLAAIIVNVTTFTIVRHRINNPDLSEGGHRVLGHAVLGNAIWLSVAGFFLVLPIEIVEVWRWGMEGGFPWIKEQRTYIMNEGGWRELGFKNFRIGNLTKGGRLGAIRLKRDFVQMDSASTPGDREKETNKTGGGFLGLASLGNIGRKKSSPGADEEQQRVESFFDVGDTSQAPTRENGFRWAS